MLLSWLGVLSAAAVAVAITALLTPLAIQRAHHIGWLDHPDGERKRQHRPVPVVGGVIIFTTFLLISAGGWLALGRSREHLVLLLSIAIPAAIVFVVGVYDDLYTSSPQRRLLFQTAAALISSVLTLNSKTHVRIFDISILDQLIGILWIVALTNAFNFIDNMDGHSLTITASVAVALAISAGVNNQWIIASTSAVIAASAIVILRWNWNPAKIYLGDGGALFIGFLLATLALRLELSDHAKISGVVLLVAIFVIPLLDIAVAVVGRLRRGVSPVTAGTDHLSHRIQSLGFTPQKSVLILSSGSFAFGLLVTLVVQTNLLGSLVSFGALLIILLAALWFFIFRTRPL